MSDQRPLVSMKKAFFYNFFPSKAEEEACKINNTPHEVTQELVEIRDLYPAPRIDLQNPWKIKKKITHDEIVVGMLMIPFFEMVEYILRYWTLDVAKSLENGSKVCVDMWDVTEENIPKKYEGGSVWFRKLFNGDFYLWSIELFKGRILGDGDEIGLYWDPRSSTLVFKLLSQVGS
ncbi:B3 domain-containing protein At1g10455 [Solanum stenotomum]|uniref:B3 domain-containing protein At1g10455 n=1 Tax=Solanum stenotomum TaxID=172797 RepID=UPI0020D06FD8|nr:B3 domain-containing protein At1g10455 [Solanum stenotomum]